MAEADFEIDFYGDANNDQSRDQDYDRHQENGNRYHDDGNGHDGGHDGAHDGGEQHAGENRQAGGRHGGNEGEAPPAQGTKRKSEDLDRPVDNGGTSAIMISELNWWMTDDDIRGWLRKANSEDEVKELTFSEHKVNGKSKGQAYVEFESRQAATAAKRYIDQLSAESNQPGQKKTTTSYWNPGINPFKTLPKDAPMRAKEQQQQPQRVQSGPYPDRGSYGGGFRGRGGMGGGRGGMNPNFNRNFNNNNMGFNPMGGGFQNPMGGGGGNFGFNPRGGGMMGGGMGGGMRGNPGGMRGRGGGMMGMNPMGGMNMMPGNMGMGMMGGGMPGFQGMNPNFGGNFGFNQNQGGNSGGDWGNPHGAKRPRPE
ncbi:Cleavage and polyadenylation specificity factor subunit [Escovopsis weberi]|uniref:Cleavage and polyadenylation specificity factor subunit n=1 Tax=Escovopsis weberi TaxID=150374 RepID=A0A0M8MZD2_ESCWE|nr:Cleavage and polyadenylation specificity factor subunit [Escovopsis weberi]